MHGYTLHTLNTGNAHLSQLHTQNLGLSTQENLQKQHFHKISLIFFKITASIVIFTVCFNRVSISLKNSIF